jgi:methyl-accepting chemotaxis protein
LNYFSIFPGDFGMKIKTLLFIGILCNLAILTAILVSFSMISASNSCEVNSMVHDEMPELLGLNEALAQGARCSIATRNVVINPADTKTRENFKEAAKLMDTAFDDAIAANANDPQMKGKLEKLKSQGVEYRNVAWSIQELAVSGANDQAVALLKEKEVPSWRDFRSKVTESVKEGKTNFAKHSITMAKTLKTGNLIMIVLCLVGMILVLVNSLIIARNIYRQLGGEPAEVSKAAIAIADGDLTISLQSGKGGIYGAMSVMAGNLRQVLDVVSRTSSEVAAAAVELNASAHQTSSASQEVVEQAGTVATASEEMAATSTDIASNCHSAADSSAIASRTANSGAAIIRNTMQNMDAIAVKVRHSATVVEQLGTRSEQIGNIVGTIEDIADQTNLLALNAAIEAARAGEQGRGFAVVADEVRALAERTTRATREIGEMIKAVQNETKKAVEVMNQGVTDVAKGADEAVKSGAAITEILNQIDQVTTQINQIATAAEEQTATTQEITNNIQQIADSVGMSARSSQEISEASSRLTHLSVEMQSTLEKFRLA